MRTEQIHCDVCASRVENPSDNMPRIEFNDDPENGDNREFHLCEECYGGSNTRNVRAVLYTEGPDLGSDVVAINIRTGPPGPHMYRPNDAPGMYPDIADLFESAPPTRELQQMIRDKQERRSDQ